MWRVGARCLPTRDLLRQRRIEVSDVCPLCQLEKESIFHVLVDCSFARSCWRLSSIGFVRGNVSNLLDWLNLLLRQIEVKDISLVFMICWAIWNY